MRASHRRYYYYILISFITYLLPFAIYVFCNKTAFFNNKSSISVVVYLAIAFSLGNLIRLLKIKEHANSVLIISIVLFIIAIIFKYIGDLLFTLSVLSLIGCVASAIFERVATQYRFIGWHEGRKVECKTLKHKDAWKYAIGLGINER